ncbi:hypothetical protein KL930_000782 [Ogataea haglerorum]|nr:hypothetical protein KL915_000784 [Ogataea haglerorum]KAG7711566.1 hypothetical protein KL914_000208 [Ogataea haglerorum]KAG7745527.1 hypothetical protein KL932_000557 [Ogataea haglerorum]KAG7781412.1 hypothetical protein KL922_000334 [Ogataea haglerorum]KAG7782320.1 hypothetical protein KL930_000782 [Ogataea haglerorum]
MSTTVMEHVPDHDSQTPDSPLSPSDRSSTPSSVTSSAATSVADTGDLTKPVSAPSPSKSKKEERHKKYHKTANRTVAAASGISTTVPVSGERPRPSPHSTLDDDVLFAIFEILYDHDPKAEGMTVKQICDILVEKHPEMAKLSSKTSNLVSAKLNAYVKRVEKGEKTIIYSLSRDWADASPKRMVYVYRGLLAKDYHLYVQQYLESQKAMEHTSVVSGVVADLDAKDLKKYKKAAQNAAALMAAQVQTQHGLRSEDFGDKRSPFLDASLDLRLANLAVPYAVAPVTASLVTASGDSNPKTQHPRAKSVSAFSRSSPDSDEDVDDYDTLRSADDDDDDDDDGLLSAGYHRRSSVIVREKVPSSVGKRSKSMSFINPKKPRTVHLTAAAATPRIPKNASLVNSPTAAAAVAALRAAVMSFSPQTESVNTITSSILADTSVEPSISMKWLETVRSGFLTQEIGAPEDISLAELDTLFT